MVYLVYTLLLRFELGFFESQVRHMVAQWICSSDEPGLKLSPKALEQFDLRSIESNYIFKWLLC